MPPLPAARRLVAEGGIFDEKDDARWKRGRFGGLQGGRLGERRLFLDGRLPVGLLGDFGDVLTSVDGGVAGEA